MSFCFKRPATSCGVDVPRNECGTTPLMIACLQGSPDIVKLLLKHGAQVSLANEQGLTPLHHGVWGGDVKCVKQVLSRGGRTVLTQRDGWGRTSLLIAAAKVLKIIFDTYNYRDIYRGMYMY